MHMSIFSENGYVFYINWSFFCLVQIQSRRGINWAKTQVICHFLKYGFLVLLEITYNKSLQQFITSSTVKPMKKLLCQKRAKIYPKISFFCIFKFGSLLFLEIAYNYSLQQCSTSIRAKIHHKNFGVQFVSKGPKSDWKLVFFAIRTLPLSFFSKNLVLSEDIKNDIFLGGTRVQRQKSGYKVPFWILKVPFYFF